MNFNSINVSASDMSAPQRTRALNQNALNQEIAWMAVQTSLPAQAPASTFSQSDAIAGLMPPSSIPIQERALQTPSQDSSNEVSDIPDLLIRSRIQDILRSKELYLHEYLTGTKRYVAGRAYADLDESNQLAYRIKYMDAITVVYNRENGFFENYARCLRTYFCPDTMNEQYKRIKLPIDTLIIRFQQACLNAFQPMRSRTINQASTNIENIDFSWMRDLVRDAGLDPSARRGHPLQDSELRQLYNNVSSTDWWQLQLFYATAEGRREGAEAVMFFDKIMPEMPFFDNEFFEVIRQTSASESVAQTFAS